jgi:poly-beta-1,6-N-acetyl-D-glucosamine synthase
MLLIYSILVIYCLILVYYTFSVKKDIINLSEISSYKSFSILIPFRNEEKNLKKLIFNLNNLQYPKEYFEVIFIDDFSEDESDKILLALLEDVHFNFQYIKNRDKGKKTAINTGVFYSKFENIITTDADCSFNKHWLHSFNYNLQKKSDLKLIAGAVFIEGADFLGVSQLIEMAGLQAVTQNGFLRKNPTMCNGANLCFSKAVFIEVNGYEGFDKIASGDDEFLLYKIKCKHPYNILYSNNDEIIVKTNAIVSVPEFISQRKRWASKIFYRKDFSTILEAVFVYVFHFLFVIALFKLIVNFTFSLFTMILVKFLIEFVFLSRAKAIFTSKKIFNYVLIFQPIYSIYVIFVGLSLVNKSYHWKQRVVH